MYKILLWVSISFLLLSGVGWQLQSPGFRAAGKGGIVGTVKLNWPPPRLHAIDTSGDPICEQQHSDHPLMTERSVVGSNGGLANVVVYISAGWSSSQTNSTLLKPVQIRQKGCQFIPHLVALDVNQTLEVINDDPTTHDIHIISEHNQPWQDTQMAGARPLDRTFAHDEVAIKIVCNTHPWMRGYIAVVTGPHAVTDQSGSFVIEDIPPGTYTLTAWQEAFGTKTEQVTVVPAKTARAEFSFQPK